MCAALINNNVEEAANEQQVARRFARYMRPVFDYAMEIVLAPVHLVQRMFYRPNTIQDEFVVEDLAAKCKSEITQTYIQCYTQKTRTRPVEAKQDPRRTYDNLDICQSGTFKTIASPSQLEETVPELILIDEIKEPEPVSNVVYLHSPSLSDSQILRARPSLSDSQIMRASGAQVCFTQSGVYQLIEPDINPHGLQQFIEEQKEEKTA